MPAASSQLWLLVSCLSDVVWLSCAPICGQLPSLVCCEIRKILKAMRRSGGNRRQRRAMEKAAKTFSITTTTTFTGTISSSKRYYAAIRQLRRTKDRPGFSPFGTIALIVSRCLSWLWVKIIPSQKPPSDGHVGWLHYTHGWKDTGFSLVILALDVAIIHSFSGSGHTTPGRLPFHVSPCWAIIPGVLAIIKQHITCCNDAQQCAPTTNNPRQTDNTTTHHSVLSPATKGNRVSKKSGGKKPRSNKKSQDDDPSPSISQDAGVQDVPDMTGSMACPFYKFDSQLHRGCAGLCLRGFQQVCQHLIRAHLLGELYCPRCWKKWNPTKQDEVRQHAAHTIARQCISVLGPERLLPDEEEILRRGAPRGLSDEAKWFWVWETFFSGHPPPRSAYTISAVQETIDYFRQGHARDALAAALVELVESESESFSADALMTLMQTTNNGLTRRLRRWPLLYPDTLPTVLPPDLPHTPPGPVDIDMGADQHPLPAEQPPLTLPPADLHDVPHANEEIDFLMATTVDVFDSGELDEDLLEAEFNPANSSHNPMASE